MAMRFIHKGGRIIPIHSDHGDQPNSSGEHAQQANPPANPAPVPGSDNAHPEPRKPITPMEAVMHVAGGAAAGAGIAGPPGAALGAGLKTGELVAEKAKIRKRNVPGSSSV